MKISLLGSGGCIPIPKPLCQCKICREARKKGRPFSRSGPSIFIHDINLLIDTPPQIIDMVNNANLKQIDYLMFTHLDGDHFDGHSLLISICFDGLKYAYSTYRTVQLLIPPEIEEKLSLISTQYGSLYDFYLKYNVLKKRVIIEPISIGELSISPIHVKGNPATAFMYLLSDHRGKKILYAPCDTRPFPFDSEDVYNVDIFITQPGYFESGLRDGFKYPKEDPTRDELYSFAETLEIAERIKAKKIIFTHIEEYWNRSYSDYIEIEKEFNNVKFGYDGMEIEI